MIYELLMAEDLRDFRGIKHEFIRCDNSDFLHSE